MTEQDLTQYIVSPLYQNECCFLSLILLITHKMKMACLLTKTKILWANRLAYLGKGSTLGKCREIRNPKAIAVMENVSIADNFILAALTASDNGSSKITINRGCSILYNFQCNAAYSVTIGRNVLIASNVFITDSDHIVELSGLPVTRNAKGICSPVEIGSNCWIGQNAVILKGVTIGDNCVIGANSVVTRDVEDCSVVAGNPARLIKKISDQEQVIF